MVAVDLLLGQPRRAAAGRRRLHRRCVQPRPPPLPDHAAPGAGRAGRRRAQHDRRGERAGLAIDFADAGTEARRPGRADPGEPRHRPGRAQAGRRCAPPRAARRHEAVPFPEPFEHEVAALGEVLGGEVDRSSLAGCCSTSAATPSSGSSTKHGAARRGPRRGRSRRGWPRPAVRCPAVEARTRYALDPPGRGRLRTPAGDNAPVTWTDRLDRVLTHRVWGTLDLPRP